MKPHKILCKEAQNVPKAHTKRYPKKLKTTFPAGYISHFMRDIIIEQGSAQANNVIINPDTAHTTSSSTSVLDRTSIGNWYN